MNGQAELARRYRQRLALYPRAYRRDHEEEMLAVLLEGARPGQEFPRIAESADLIWGALRMRLRLGYPFRGNVGSDALAVFSLVAPLLRGRPCLVDLRCRLWRPARRLVQGLFLTCYLLEAAALIVSPGPRRGLELLTWKSAAALAPAAAALTITWTLTMRLMFGSAFTSSGDAQGNAVAVVAIITFAAGTVLFSSSGGMSWCSSRPCSTRTGSSSAGSPAADAFRTAQTAHAHAHSTSVPGQPCNDVAL